MKINRIPAVPLITCDPYFSLWSPADELTGADICHWTGKEKKVLGTVSVDGETYRWMGQGSAPALPQTGLELTPTSTTYRFAGAGVELEVRFTTPLLLSDLELVSRPCSYLHLTARALDGRTHELSLNVTFDQSHIQDAPAETPAAVLGGVHALSNANAAWMGKAKQIPLGHSGDGVSIDWGYLYLAAPRDMAQVEFVPGENGAMLMATVPMRVGEEAENAFLVAAYDDVASIMYFGRACKGYWARNGKTILEAVEDAVRQQRLLLSRCEVFDDDLTEKAQALAGEPYALICALAYRQAIAAHKLICDEAGNVIYLSKECYSNGCIGTVDVSYPSIPLFLMYAPELVKGMMRPVFRFARMPVWQYDFAPHDVGRYPYANGQVYGLKEFVRVKRLDQGDVFPPYYQYPANADAYRFDRQMPVEECGNMLIMCAAVAQAEGNAEFALDNMDLLEKWVTYLLQYGEDPGNQLCTDDFAGHMAHNVNLSAKAIMGVESYALLLAWAGRAQEAESYHRRAARMAESWLDRAERGGHTALTFDGQEGWSLKYNLIWDLLFESRLFPDTLYRNEVDWYLQQQNAYGTPLDSRKAYTKSDWLLWCSAMTQDREKMSALIRPIVGFLHDSPQRLPFGDWYETETAEKHGFTNRTVQGGLFMPLLKAQWEQERRD